MQVHHIGYLVKNITKAEKDFEALGYVCEAPLVFDSIRKVDISFWINGESRVELVSPKGEDSVVYGLLKTYKNMPYHICYISENMEADLEMLRGRGYFQMDEPTEAPAIGGRKVCFLMSGASGMIELLEDVK